MTSLNALKAKSIIYESVKSLIFWILPIAIVDACVWFLAGGQVVPVIVTLFLHIFLCSLAAYVTYAYHNEQKDIRFGVFSVLFGAFLGPFGFGMVLLSAVIYLLLPHRTLDPRKLLRELLPEFEEHSIVEAAHRLRSGLDRVDADTTPVPFLDIMSYGSVEQKRAVMSICLRHFSPQLTNVLRVGLHDPSNSVRVLAATAIVALKEKYQERFDALERELELHPDHLDNVEAFADHASAFALSHIIGEEQTAHVRQYAISAYQKLHQHLQPSSKNVISLARLYLEENNPEAAMQELKPWIDRSDDNVLTILCLYGDALFRAKRYEELRELSRKGLVAMSKANFESDEMNDILALWASGVSK